jgi:signal transduction histidine kinase
MRIAARFALVFGVTTGLLFAGYGAFAIRAEERDLRTSAEREVRTLAQSIELAVETSMRDRQPLEVQGLFDRMELVNPEMDLVVLSRDGWWRSSDPSARALDAGLAPLLERAAADRVDVWEAVPSAAERRFVLAVPIVAGKRVAGAVAIVRPLDDVHADLRRTEVTIWSTIVVAVLVIALLAVVLATVTLTRPLRQMTAAMTRVRAGDMAATLPVKRGDELGAAAVEFNAMLVDLSEARRLAEREAEARRQMQRSLERSDKLVTIGQLAAGLAHEIGTPLHVVAGRARSLQQKTDGDEVRRVSGIIVEQCERITRVVEQLLRYARRPASGVAEVDAREPIRAVLALLEGEARRRGVTVTFVVDPETPRVMASADQLQQVVLNLVRNSITACEPGARIDVRLSPASPRAGIALSVKDSGPGIRPEDVPHLFEPFFTTRSEAGGTGLGLAVVRSIVNDHGGTIEVTSNGTGAEFIVHLPIDGMASDANAKEAA